MNDREDVHVPPNVRLVAKIGSSVTAASLLGLLLVLIALTDDKASGYGQIIGAFGLAKENLSRVMIIFGLAMACFAGIATWLFALYASFRIAGPVYRLSQNLERQIEQGPVAPMPIRATDCLQREWKAFEASVLTLGAHHEALRLALGEIENASQANNRTGNANALALAMARLQEVEQHVHL